MKKITLFFTFLLAFGMTSYAQVAAYSFTQTAGTFTAITGGTVLSSPAADDAQYAVTLPTAFTFSGTAYTAMNVSSNGFITFGTTAPGTTNYTPISSTTAFAGSIAAFGRDLNSVAAGSEIRWEQVGNEIIVQWLNVRRYNITGEQLNFQIRLNTADNSIRAVYGTCVAGSSSTYPQVGLRGASNSAYNNRTIAVNGGAWINSVAGTANNNTMYFNSTDPTTAPASGLTYTWSPPNCTTPSVTYTVVPNCPAGTDFSISVNIASIGTASGVTITDNQGTAPSAGLTAGTYTYGTYASGTNVTVTVTNDDNAVCANVSGNLTFGGTCPPANDNFANAIPLTCGQNVTGSTVAATLDEDNAPDGFGADLDAPNVWYTYTGSGSPEVITINMCPSAYDTSFLVYTGTSGNLTLVGGNDDGGTANCPGAGTRSFGTFQSDGVQTYYITVEGWNVGSVGAFDLTLTCAPACTPAQANQDCASAVGINVDGNATTVDNTCATINPTQNCDSFNSIADVWYSFTAPVSGTVNVTAVLGTATAVHMAVYSGTCGALVSEGCSTADPTASLTLTSLVGGNTYYLQLWNNGTEEGTFDVTLTDPSLSVGSFENNEFTYFPNPVKNTLSLRAQKEIQNVSIYNMIGQEVLRSTPNTLTDEVDMSSLQTGAYFVKVTIDNSTEVIRIVKQ